MIVYNKHQYSSHWEFENQKYENYRELLHGWMNEFLLSPRYVYWRNRLIEEEKLEWIGLSSFAAHFHHFVMKKLDDIGPNITTSERQAIYWFTAGVDMDSIIYLLKDKLVIWIMDSVYDKENIGIESLFVHLS